MATAIDPTGPEYVLNTGTDLGREQLECLDLLLDDSSTTALNAIGVRPGDRCLEIGAGSGSIARRLAARVAPGGRVVAVDLKIDRLASGPCLDVRQHDINNGVPEGGPYDLIHARLVLMHLRRRREITAELITALAPGGWLVIGEYAGLPLEVVSAPSRADAELFRRVVEVTINEVGRPAGISYEWSGEVDAHLAQAGLVNVHSQRHNETAVGGSIGCILLRNYLRQVRSAVRSCGVADQELDRFDGLMMDPRFRTWLFDFTCVRAQKPAETVRR